MNVFEITVQRKTEGRWPAVVEYTHTGALPTVRQGWLELDSAGLSSQVTALDYGRMLGQALFRNDLRDLFVQAMAAGDDRLHVLLHVEDDNLRTLRWERLCAPIDGQWNFLLLNQRTPFSLYLPSVTDRRFPPFGRLDLRALIVAASPDGLEEYGLQPFDVAAAVQRVRVALGDIPSDTLAASRDVPDAVGPPTLDALAAQITAQPYTLLHVICHGSYVPATGETVFFAATRDNRPEPVTATALIERLRTLQGLQGLPQLAYLATCDSAAPQAEAALGGLGQRLVRELGLPAVVAMTERVSVETADALSTAFYSRLREHGEVDRALAEATASLAGRFDVTVPALFSRLGGRPLFSDALDREPTPAEIERGLGELARLLPERSPVLLAEYTSLAARLRGTLTAGQAALSSEARTEQQQALAAVNALCEEVLDLSFNGLCFGLKPPSYDARCPFPGLAAFDADASQFFFGREKLVEQLAARLAEHNLLPVLGPSGCGKSSLVLAGLGPALQRLEPGLQVVVMRPGSDPVAQLEKATLPPPPAPAPAATAPPARAQPPGQGAPLGGEGGKKGSDGLEAAATLLVVDQFEELFTLTQDVAQRSAFVERLLAEAERRRVVLTMRGDFLDDCAAFPKLYAALQSRLQLIAPMSPAELRSAMEQQAGAVGLRFEADLAHTILDDVAGEPGAMPLLQHGLLELWKRRHGRWLRASEYRGMGGVQQAIARTAEGVYGSLPAAEQSLMRNICLRLVRLDEGEGRRDTRRRAALDELVTSEPDRPAVVRLVNRLADEKLVVTSINPVTGREEVELAHEALIGEWGRLREWVEEDRAGNLVRQQLGQTVALWTNSNRDQSYLYRGKRLKSALNWTETHTQEINRDERAFLRSSRRVRTRQRALQGVVAGIAVMLLLATINAMIGERWIFSPKFTAIPVSDFENSEVIDGAWQNSRVGYVGFGYKKPDTSAAKSTDGGKTWQHLDLKGSFVNALAIDPSNPLRLYALFEEEGLARSNDGGINWERVQTELPVGFHDALAVSPDNTLYIGDPVDKRGVFYSKDGGESWQPIPGSPSIAVFFLGWYNDHLVVGSDPGLWLWSEDTGWQHLLGESSLQIASVSQIPNGLIVAGGQGIYLLGQGKSPKQLYNNGASSVVADSGNPPSLLASTTDNRLLYWRAGESRARAIAEDDILGQPVPYIWTVLAAPGTDGEFWVATDRGLFEANVRHWYQFFR